MTEREPSWRELLDPEAAAVAETIRQSEIGPLRDLGAEKARALMNSGLLQGSSENDDLVTDLTVPTRAGTIPARLYRAVTTQVTAPVAGPALVYFHGGGFVLGTLNGVDELCRAVAAGSGWAVLSVDYRLAPEHPYPAALEDCVDAYSWLIRTARERGIDSRHVAVGGDSAGGNLAAALCLYRRHNGDELPVAQVLAYPAVDDRFATPSWSEFADAPLLSAPDARWCWEQYVGTNHPGGDPFAAPMRAESLRDLPPALVITAEVDPVRDDSEAYARRLRGEGVQVSLTRHAGVFHGFLSEVELFTQAMDGVDEICAFLTGLRRADMDR